VRRLDLFVYILFLSSYYCLVTVGISLVFGVMKIINFAHGEFYMIGGVIVWYIMSIFGNGIMNSAVLFILAIIVAMIFVGILAIIVEYLLFRPLKDEPFSAFMVSYGLLYILQVTVAEIFGRKERSMSLTPFPGNISIFGATISYQRLAVIIFAVVLLIFLGIFLKKSKWGCSIRACSQDSLAAALQGVNSRQIAMLVMGLGSALAAAAGGLVGASLVVTPYMGEEIIWKAFVFVIIGGLGSNKGVIVSSIAFGVLHSLILMAGYSEYSQLINVIAMLIILTFKPQGVFGVEN